MAVYTRISEEDLKEFLKKFSIGTLVLQEPITQGVSNTNYAVTTTTGKFILTIFEERTKTEDLPFFVSFMRHLASKNIPCSDVVADFTENTVHEIAGKKAMVTTFLNGGDLAFPDVPDCEKMGETLAQMHLSVADFEGKRANTLSLPAWERLISACGGGTIPDLLKEISFLKEHWPKNLPQGAVHADLFPDNVFFEERDISGIIDFYFAATDSFVYDLMLTYNAWCFDDGALDPEKSDAFLEAYQKIRPLNLGESLALSFMGRAAAVRIIATRLYDQQHPVQGALIKPKDPEEYIAILRHHQKATA